MSKIVIIDLQRWEATVVEDMTTVAGITGISLHRLYASLKDNKVWIDKYFIRRETEYIKSRRGGKRFR